MSLQVLFKQELFRRQVQEDIIYKDFIKYNYFLLEGGRSSGKTQRVARLLLYLSLYSETRLRIFCGRETQNTIQDSVYQVFVDLIKEYEFPFLITNNYIISSVNNSEIRFKGFREQGRYNVQGLEGIDILWIDEAQAITKNTLDIIIPTIRKEKSKIFFSMNRFDEQDPVYNKFNRDMQRLDTLHLTINYFDNKYNSSKILYEAEECKKTSLSDYLHIWMGEPRRMSDDCVINLEEIKQAINRNVCADGQIVIGIDVARFGDDKTVMFKKKGLKAIGYREYSKQDTKQISQLAKDFANYDKEVIFNVDDTGVGGGVSDNLIHDGYPVNRVNNGSDAVDKDKYCNCITEMFFNFKELLKDVSIFEDYELFKELTNRKYHYDKKTGRRIIESKDEFKKRMKKSPDKGDACLLAFYIPKNFYFDKKVKNMLRNIQDMPTRLDYGDLN